MWHGMKNGSGPVQDCMSSQSPPAAVFLSGSKCPRHNSPWIPQVEADELEQVGVSHFGEDAGGAVVVAEDVGGEGLLVADELVYAFFERAFADEFVDENVLRLADAEGAVGGLVFDGSGRSG